jgi:hypothetical protein
MATSIKTIDSRVLVLLICSVASSLALSSTLPCRLRQEFASDRTIIDERHGCRMRRMIGIDQTVVRGLVKYIERIVVHHMAPLLPPGGYVLPIHSTRRCGGVSYVKGNRSQSNSRDTCSIALARQKSRLPVIKQEGGVGISSIAAAHDTAGRQSKLG